MKDAHVGFRPLAVPDLVWLHRWLNEPHVVATYGWGRAPDRDEVERTYGARARGEGRTRAFVIEVAGRPVGYLQTYRILDHPAWATEAGVADESHGVDLFLGEADLLGLGLGTCALRTFVEEVLFATTDAVAVVGDPASTNLRAVRAFEKAGFRRWRTLAAPPPGSGDLLLRRERRPNG